MKIITCYKLVPEEQDINVKSDGSLDISKASLKISQFDLSAVEAAVQIKEANPDSTIMALSVGGVGLANPKACKDILSRGPDSLTIVSDQQFERVLPHVTARVLAAVVQKSEFDLIICGDGSSDLYAQQVGLLLGELLEIPTINGVSKIIATDQDKIVVERELDDEVEVLELKLPAVISVSADINEPQIPSMKAILGAGKKSIIKLNASDIELGTIPSLVEVIAVTAPKNKDRKKIIIQGDNESQLSEFTDYIRKVLN